LNLRQFGPCASAGNNRQSDAEASGPVPVPADRDRRLHESTPGAGHRFTSRYHAPAEVFCGALEVLLNKAAETESIQINRLGQSVAFDRLLARNVVFGARMRESASFAISRARRRRER
jgi:hypothetical protein